MDEAWHCRPGSCKEVSMVWTGNNADDFELLWDGMQVELWLKLDFGQLALADWVIIEVFISDRFGLMAAMECDATLDLVRTELWWLAERSHAR